MRIPKKKIGCLGSLIFICFLMFIISFAIFIGGILAIAGTIFAFICLSKLIFLILHKFYDAIEQEYETKRAEGKLTLMRKILNAFNMKNWKKTKDKQPENILYAGIETNHCPETIRQDKQSENISYAEIETNHCPETIRQEENLERFMIECNAWLAHQDEMAQYGIYDKQGE